MSARVTNNYCWYGSPAVDEREVLMCTFEHLAFEMDKEKCFETGKELRRVCKKRKIFVQFRSRITTLAEREADSEEWERSYSSEEEATEPSDNDWLYSASQRVVIGD